MRAAYLIPKTDAEINQTISLLHSKGYTSNPSTYKAGNKITVWFNTERYSLNTSCNFSDHTEIKPNELHKYL